MDITEVSVEYSRTVNLGNFESERVQVGMTATVGGDETWMGVLHDLGLQARDTVALQLREAERQRQAERRRRYPSGQAGEAEDDGPREDEG